MEITKKLYAFLLCIVFALSCPISTNALDQTTVKNEVLSVDRKLRCDATIDQMFDGDSVLVVVDRNVSSINKQFEVGFFRRN